MYGCIFVCLCAEVGVVDVYICMCAYMVVRVHMCVHLHTYVCWIGMWKLVCMCVQVLAHELK